MKKETPLLFGFCMFNYLSALLLLWTTTSCCLSAASFTELRQGLLRHHPSPFGYNLNIHMQPGKNDIADIMICFHGFGSDHTFIDILKNYPAISDHLVSFDFPDAGISNEGYDPKKTSFGTIQELLPALYVIKKCITAGSVQKINLYGFSAGGGALINILSVLNTSKNDEELEKIGITLMDKQKMLQAIQRGIIILDSPLKSFDEILDFSGRYPPLEVIAKRYNEQKRRPIDALKNLENLNLTIIVHFQVPDEVLSNRDDQLFISRLKHFNKRGHTFVSYGHDGGHSSFHRSLWKDYVKLLNSKKN